MPLDREWVTVRDPDDPHVHYTFDVSFLLSGYTCIYGAGCQGVRPDGPDEVIGCCAHGAYLNEDDDTSALEATVAELDPDTMQHHEEAVANGVLATDEDDETHTRLVDGACIFLNRDGFATGAGCALHHLAARRGEHHMTHKPIVCWQLPLHRTIEEDTGNDGETLYRHRIAAFERGSWGSGGADFHWWCTEEPDAFVGARPVFATMEHELRAMVGDTVYEELARYLRRRQGQRHRVRFLPVV